MYYNLNEKFTRKVQINLCMEERISKLKIRQWKLSNLRRERKKKKRPKKNEQNLKDLRNTVKWTNMSITAVPEEREKRAGRIFDEIMAKNFPI